MKDKTERIINKALDLILWGFALAGIYLLFSVFIFSSFRIPSDSMAGAIESGDEILVFKPAIGARLFNIFASLKNEQTPIYRIPGYSKIKHNDILVFNFPHPNTWDKIEMHILRYYIKRCIGLPGDDLSIVNGYYRISGEKASLGNLSAQERISTWKKDEVSPVLYNTYPFDSIIDWNIQNFGPLHIPSVGDTIHMNRTNFVLYRKLIEWEQNGKLTFRDSSVYLNDQRITNYTFQKNYYFVSGDRTEDSQDSRYWGMLPEEYIVGKAWIIWYATDPNTGKIDWKRCLKRIK